MADKMCEIKQLPLILALTQRDKSVNDTRYSNNSNQVLHISFAETSVLVCRFHHLQAWNWKLANNANIAAILDRFAYFFDNCFPVFA